MSIVSALVLLAVIWFLTLFVVIPITLETQEEAGEEVVGTHAGAPSSRFSMKRTAGLTTLWALGIWGVVTAVILWGGITVEDIDLLGLSRRAFAE